jgi:polysaccharide biosynthesis protein PslH
LKILWVKPGKLLPLDTGGKLRTYNILRHLSAAHSVTYLSYYGGLRDPNYEREVSELFPGALPTFTGIPERAGLRRMLDYLRRLPRRAPDAVGRFESAEVKRIVAAAIAHREFDVAISDFLASTPNFPQDLAIPAILFQHNVESVLWQRRAQFETKFVDRVIAKIETAKMSRYEAEQVRRFRHVFAVSEADRNTMAAVVDRSRISVIPTGVDLETFRYDPRLKPAGPFVVFVGSMDWHPNINGVEYFCNEIWPQVLSAVPAARFQVVGRNPHPRVRKLASASVEITGTVPSVTKYIRDAAVLVVPLRIGGGTRIKIYEGMAMGKATVSTSLGVEGLDVHQSQDILLADQPQQFAQWIVALLQNETLRQKIEVAAARTASQYDWSIFAERFVREIQRVTGASTIVEPHSPLTVAQTILTEI